LSHKRLLTPLIEEHRSRVVQKRKMSGFSLKRFFLRSLDREPMVVVATALGLVGVSFALLGPKIRKRLGYETFQWHGVDHEKLAVEKAHAAEFVREIGGQAPVLKRS
jgi:hypothetical protein